MAVRTQSLAAGNLAAGTNSVYTCPAGKTAIVKEIVISHIGNTSTTSVRMIRSGASNGIRIWREVMTADFVYRAERWTVLEPGDSLQIVTNAGTPATVAYAISGTELDGVA